MERGGSDPQLAEEVAFDGFRSERLVENYFILREELVGLRLPCGITFNEEDAKKDAQVEFDAFAPRGNRMESVDLLSLRMATKK